MYFSIKFFLTFYKLWEVALVRSGGEPALGASIRKYVRFAVTGYRRALSHQPPRPTYGIAAHRAAATDTRCHTIRHHLFRAVHRYALLSRPKQRHPPRTTRFWQLRRGVGFFAHSAVTAAARRAAVSGAAVYVDVWNGGIAEAAVVLLWVGYWCHSWCSQDSCDNQSFLKLGKRVGKNSRIL